MDKIRVLSSTVFSKLEARIVPEIEIEDEPITISPEKKSTLKRQRSPEKDNKEITLDDTNSNSQAYSKPPSQPDITSFFAPKSFSSTSKPKRKKVRAEKPVENKPDHQLNDLKIKVTNLEFANLKLEKKVMELRTEKEADKELLARHKDELDRTNNQLRKEQAKSLALRNRFGTVLIDLIRDKDDSEYIEDQKRASISEFELGKVVSFSTKLGKKGQDKWQNGEKFNDLDYRIALVQERRKLLEQMKKDLTKRKAKLRRSSNNDKDVSNSVSIFNSENDFNESVLQDLEITEAEESLKIKFIILKKQEAELLAEKDKLRIDKFLFIRLLKRLNYQSKSKFVERPVLNDRYLLRKLIGKGGFSEVWKAFDLKLGKDVAIKFHEIDRNWKQSKVDRYLTHVAREYKIHLALDHPNIVKLENVFEINNSTFATVLQYCEGVDIKSTDLDIKLKLNKMLSEREARAILLQILSALRYLNTGEGLEKLDKEDNVSNSYEPTKQLDKSNKKKQHPSIIHYDLKPANILFDEMGNVKISDFGLSKIIKTNDCDDSGGIELTSQFAGTYWYLPPECFFVPHNQTSEEDKDDDTNTVDVRKLLGIEGDVPMKISSKVDVWSVGVIFYQMLFGKRPFGEGMTPNTILHSQTMLKANKVEFPEKPTVSDEAKRFIKKCLTYRQQLRPDVIQLCYDPYLRQKKI